METSGKNFLREFFEATAMDPETTAVLPERKDAFPVEKPIPAGARLIPLPEPGLLPDKNVNFLEMVELRSTVRQYTAENLTMQELSYLLWCTQGIKMVLPNGATRRNVPSAGGCHAFETYLYLRRVEGAAPGLYRFLALEHGLILEAPAEEIEEEFLSGFKASQMVRNSAVTFVWTADAGRMADRFGNRACRYLFLDGGHLCENLYLAGQTIHVGVCAIGAFYDARLHRALKLSGEREFVVYGASVGKMGD